MFSENLAILLKKNNISANKLSQICEIPQTTISSYVTGKKEPSVTNAQKIADHFGVSVDYLLTGKEEPNVPDVPNILNDVQVAFAGGAGNGLDKDDIQMLVEMAKRMKKGKDND